MENKKQNPQDRKPFNAKFKPKPRTIKTEYKVFDEKEIAALLKLKQQIEKNEQKNEKAK
jgi:hypothetical protein